MNAAHKILTVSYGTFSCTLEGFDDPFNTMKAIAEYFRDLAAEDRYFGAEPPQPDAAMLHKIAEREIQRRVEAKIQENGVVLRAREAEAAPPVEEAPDAAAAPPQSAPARSADPTPAPTPAERVSVTMGQAQAAAAPAAPRMLADDAAAAAMASAAQRLQRLRAAQAGAQITTAVTAPMAAPVAAPVAAPAEAPVSAPELAPEPAPVAPPVVAPVAETATEPASPAPTLLDAAPAPEAKPEDLIAPAPLAEAAELPASTAPEIEDTDPQAELAQAEAPAAEVEAAAEADDALLSALRETLSGALDSDSIAPEPAPEPQPFDMAALTLEPTEDLPEAEPEALSPEADLPEIVEETLAEAEEAAQAEIEASATLAAILAAPEPEDLPAPEMAADEELPEAPFAEPEAWSDAVEAPAEEPDAFEEPEAPAEEPEAFEEPEALAEPEAPTEPEAVAAEAEAAPEAIFGAEPAPLEEAAPQVAEKIQRARARVIKIRRIEAQAAPETAPETAPEADPSAALRAVMTEPQPETPANRLPAVETDEASVNRLLQKAATEFEEPQTKRRRSAIAHLKAAVLATVAERRAKGAAKPDDSLRENPYRQDLDQAMRPAAEKPAPLVLLPTLRIDQRAPAAQAPAPAAAPAPVAVQPVRPRRVTAAALAQRPAFAPEEDELAAAEGSNVFSDGPGQSFQDFADGLGAHSLQDLIEAAGAYLTLTKGEGGFTRPELFAQLTAAGSEPSREDGLRGFGRLLREGRLTKTEAGTYALTETSPMLAQVKRRAS
ncbi:hypothetical protein [Stagnihabitans tardus]|uniref:Chemotaxis protein CheA n=1 Tax=Stagnihabitans tardus TaxID=2699202 RepID=A0AAE5BTU7_9RHOB|nr:hypothetical protein [Stagnihabitans tardus]NBZ89450.1 hypothetical protein [Stagnihabitans tardus]